MSPTPAAAALDTLAVVLNAPESLEVSRLPLTPPGDEDVVVDVEWSGISTGTERLLWNGRMPAFPGFGYPLVPGYESVGRIAVAGARSGRRPGERVFVPGARCFGDVRGLFGGAAARVVVPGQRVVPLGERLAEDGVLLALAATAHHALAAEGARPPDLIVGHGVLGRLLARLTLVGGHPPPVVWERNPLRTGGNAAYEVVAPEADARHGYRSVYDVSGDPGIVDAVMPRLAPHGEIVLAGFYNEPVHFDFPAAFMREARIRIAAEWKPADLEAVRALAESGRLSLAGLVTHREAATDAAAAYRRAFDDPGCLKMILDWRACA